MSNKEIKIGQLLVCDEDSIKSKIITDILYSKRGTSIVVYRFWNQVGNIERCSTLDNLLKNHKIKGCIE